MLLSLLVTACVLARGDDTLSQDPAVRLVVLVSIDQCIPEQLERLGPLLEGGLGRVWSEGTVFPDAMLDYANSETGAGHATMATGCLPRTHGISANTIYQREESRFRYCVADHQAQAVTQAGVVAETQSVSPRFLDVPAFGDHLKARDPRAKVVSLSSKDRSAVLMAGQDPDLVLWWDAVQGGYQTSTRYAEALPEFVREWNDTWIEQAADFEWSQTRPTRDLQAVGTAPDVRVGEPPDRGTLPLKLYGGDLQDPAVRARIAERVPSFPLADRFLVDVAQRACVSLQLGQDDATDFLAVGLSACDFIGHARGPYSVEVTDLLLRVDQYLFELFTLLDQTLGADAWVVAVTSDHGVCELPETLTEQGVPTRRYVESEMAIAHALMRQAVGHSLEGMEVDWSTWVSFDFNEVGLDEAQFREVGVDPAALRRAMAKAAMAASWVRQAYTWEDLQEPSGDPLQDLFYRAFRGDRCPDVVLCPIPRLVFRLETGTSHGTPYEYDRRVALAFLGPGVPAQRRQGQARLIDVVPTLLDYLGVPQPETMDGRVLPIGR